MSGKPRRRVTVDTSDNETGKSRPSVFARLGAPAPTRRGTSSSAAYEEEVTFFEELGFVIE